MTATPISPHIPFFSRAGTSFEPTEASRGPWGPETLNGRVVAGLLAHEIERVHGDPDFLPARLTVDMFRMSRMAPVEITTAELRSGGRVRVVEAEFHHGRTVVARASCQFLRRGENAPGEIWRPDDWSVPAPADIPPPEAPLAAVRGLWDMRQLTGDIRKEVRQRRAWLREVRELVGGEPLTPYARAAVAADYASPFSQMTPTGLGYINSDLTLYLHRVPTGEWLGFEVTDHGASEGISNSSCRLYDEDGAIGSVTVAALAQRRG